MMTTTTTNKPTLADMLSILVDRVTESELGQLADGVTEIATEILEEHGSTTFCESLAGLDPFRSGVQADPINKASGVCHAPLSAIVTGIVVLSDSRVRQVIADIDGALYRLANSGYAHRL